MNEKQFTEIQKTQAGRLRSIFLISPILIIAALMPSTPMWMRVILFTIGISTIVVVGYSVIKTNEANEL